MPHQFRVAVVQNILRLVGNSSKTGAAVDDCKIASSRVIAAVRLIRFRGSSAASVLNNRKKVNSVCLGRRFASFVSQHLVFSGKSHQFGFSGEEPVMAEHERCGRTAFVDHVQDIFVLLPTDNRSVIAFFQTISWQPHPSLLHQAAPSRHFVL